MKLGPHWKWLFWTSL